MIIHDCEQNSPEWYEARRGLVTASEFKTIIGVHKDAKDKITRAKYLRKLAGERITGERIDGFTNAAMERGHEMEAQARCRYVVETNATIMRVGFITDDARTVGASPDSFLDGGGGLEIKTAEPHILITHLERAIEDPLYFPAEHAAQVQGNMSVGEREWWDIAIFWPAMPLFVKRAYRDEPYIAKLRAAVDAANKEIEAIVTRVSAYAPWNVTPFPMEDA